MENARTAIIILGASGDLAKRKLIPALLNLCREGVMGQSTAIIGCGRSAFTDGEFRALFNASEPFASRLSYHKGIAGLKHHIADKGEFSRVIIFFSLPPLVYSETAHELVSEGFGSETSIIIEKPFGADYQTAAALNRQLARYFDESRIYRNDHYLAKEAVQNILVFRFANSLFYPVWNNQFIESIQISAAETQGVGSRAAYFDTAGILRDMVQNHLMQLLCLMTMEPPHSLAPERIAEKKVELLRAISIESCNRYQYEGYTREPGVAPDSLTETYAELKLRIDNFRWAGTPVYLRCGKKLDRDSTEIGIRFKNLPINVFAQYGPASCNEIVFMIQPQEGIIISTVSKEPGNEIRLKQTAMTFCYHNSFTKEIPEAYERLLLDAVRGDHTLFVTAAETELSWKILEPVLDKGDLGSYPQGDAPAGKMEVDWIEFGNYCCNCSRPPI